MTLGEMRTLLDSNGIRLTRSLGQNFLHDANQLRRIIALAEIRPGNPVLEIGPGLGPLTEALLATGARVVAVEKDRRLSDLLRRRFSPDVALELVTDDALAWLRRSPLPGPGWQVVSNLPYSVGSALLVELAQLAVPPASMTATLQREVVDRIRAKPATADYGLLTLLLAERYTVTGSFRIPASCFFPPPQVESACVRLELRPRPLADGPYSTTYRQLARLGFSQRRKQLRKVLRNTWPDALLSSAWNLLGLADEVRAEVLSPETFARLTMELHPGTPLATG